MEKRAAGRDPGLEAAQSLGFLVASCAGLILTLAFATQALRRDADFVQRRPDGRINPNNASLASLTRLPGVGLTRARAIIALRERLTNEDGRNPAFRAAEDLAQVRGIGPATVDGMRAWLRFDASPGDANSPASQ